ncbi:MAG: polysaccharide biosynthesis protein [Oscillospiraceae bacterium]|nr:polysaccharide biosynthesis protein [Oscillospiraceae bacterium]
MKALILSCNTGGGHNSCADAIKVAFEERGHTCDIADSLGFVSDKLSKFVSWGHTTMYRHIPGLFRAGYGFAEKHPAVLGDDTAVYKLLSDGTKQLYNYIEQGDYDTVICAHVFAGFLLRQTVLEYHLELKTAFVATDYTCSPGVAASEVDYCFIPDDSLKETFVAQGVAEEKIFSVGIPVKKEFYKCGNRAEAKKMQGIHTGHSHLMIMCGSMGCGPIEKLTKLLSKGMDDTIEVSIVCGTNKKLLENLKEAFGDVPNIHLHGFVDNIGVMMDSAELYLTKPGGLSTTEAAAKRLPMVFVDAVAGCEEYNLNYFVNIGGAVTAESAEALAQLCLNLLRDKKQLALMKSALEALPNKNAAEQICEIMCNGCLSAECCK